MSIAIILNMINPNDPARPKMIYAKHPSLPAARILLAVEGETVRIWMEEFGAESKLGEFCGLVHGVIFENDERTVVSEGLLRPHAIFKGLRRPCHVSDMNHDRDVYVYILPIRLTPTPTMGSVGHGYSGA